MADETPICCPKCGGTDGFRYTMTETHVMYGNWGDYGEAGDSGINVTRTMPVCVDCGHRFRWKTVSGIVDANSQESP
jgi:hypothetical protein